LWCCRICCWTEQAGRAKEKVALACLLRQETTMTLKWIAERLILVAAGCLANLLREYRMETTIWNPSCPLYGVEFLRGNE
jgi:hypothetical protein